MNAKDELLSKVDGVNEVYSRSPIVKGLVDGMISSVPILGAAIVSALDTRAFQLFEKNSGLFAEELRRLVERLDAEKIDKEFVESDEFVSLLTEILGRNAHAHEEEKVKLYAKLFVNASTYAKSATSYKEGFVRIIDELSVEHILALAFISKRSYEYAEEDKTRKSDSTTAKQIAEELKITEARALAYCDQMTRFGLLRDAWIGSYGYQVGTYAITDYGRELVDFLHSENG